MNSRSNEGVNEAQFLNLMRKYLAPQGRIDWGDAGAMESLAVQVIELFKQIDVRGDGEVNWQDFSGFLMQLDLSSVQGGVGSAASGDSLDGTGPVANMDPINDRKYRPVEVAHDDHDSFAGELAAMRFLPEPINQVALQQEKEGNPNLAAVVQLLVPPTYEDELPRVSGVLRHHTAYKPHRVLAVNCVTGQDLVITSSSLGLGGPHYLTIWDLPTMEERASGGQHLPVMAQRIETPSAQSTLHWSTRSEVLFTASESTGYLLGWILDEDSPPQKILSIRLHSSGIVAFEELKRARERANHLVTGSMDGTILVWDMDRGLTDPENAERAVLCVIGAHEQGVACLSQSLKYNLLFSAGRFTTPLETTPDVFVWKTNMVEKAAVTAARQDSDGAGVDGSSIVTTMTTSSVATGQSAESGRFGIDDRVFARLVGHEAQVMAVVSVDEEGHIVSADKEGCFRVWDMNTFASLHVFQANLDRDVTKTSFMGSKTHHLRSVVMLAPNPDKGLPRALLAGSTKMQLFHLKGLRLTEPLLCALYNPVFQSFATASASGVAIWNARNGALLRHYSTELLFGSEKAELTACCLDDNGRKLVAANDRGDVCVCNYANGHVMKALDPHNQQVTSVTYTVADKLALSASTDGEIHICDEAEQDGYVASAVNEGKAARTVLLRCIKLVSNSTSLAGGGGGSNGHFDRVSSTRDLLKASEAAAGGGEGDGNDMGAPSPLRRTSSMHGSSSSAARMSTNIAEILHADCKRHLNLIVCAAQIGAGVGGGASDGGDVGAQTNGGRPFRCMSLLQQQHERPSIATSSSNEGQHLLIIDFEMCHLRGICVHPDASVNSVQSDNEEVTSLAFMSPYPVLVAAMSDGCVHLWKVPDCECFLSLDPQEDKVAPFKFDTDAGEHDTPLSIPITCVAIFVPIDDSDMAEKKRSEDGGKDEEAAPAPASPSTSAPGSKVPWSDGVKGVIVYAGDEQGMLTSWYLSDAVLGSHGASPVQSQRRSSYNPYRSVRTFVTAEDIMLNRRIACKKQAELCPDIQGSSRRWVGHTDSISSVKCVRHPPSLVSASTDGLAKVWSLDGLLLGVMDANLPLPSMVQQASKLNAAEHPPWAYQTTETELEGHGGGTRRDKVLEEARNALKQADLLLEREKASKLARRQEKRREYQRLKEREKFGRQGSGSGSGSGAAQQPFAALDQDGGGQAIDSRAFVRSLASGSRGGAGGGAARPPGRDFVEVPGADDAPFHGLQGSEGTHGRRMTNQQLKHQLRSLHQQRIGKKKMDSMEEVLNDLQVFENALQVHAKMRSTHSSLIMGKKPALGRTVRPSTSAGIGVGDGAESDNAAAAARRSAAAAAAAAQVTGGGGGAVGRRAMTTGSFGATGGDFGDDLWDGQGPLNSRRLRLTSRSGWRGAVGAVGAPSDSLDQPISLAKPINSSTVNAPLASMSLGGGGDGGASRRRQQQKKKKKKKKNGAQTRDGHLATINYLAHIGC